jgi:hypothetical protein
MPIRKVAARQGIRNRSALRQKNNCVTEASRVLTQRALEHVQGLGFILPRQRPLRFQFRRSMTPGQEQGPDSPEPFHGSSVRLSTKLV